MAASCGTSDAPPGRNAGPGRLYLQKHADARADLPAVERRLRTARPFPPRRRARVVWIVPRERPVIGVARQAAVHRMFTHPSPTVLRRALLVPVVARSLPLAGTAVCRTTGASGESRPPMAPCRS